MLQKVWHDCLHDLYYSSLYLPVLHRWCHVRIDLCLLRSALLIGLRRKLASERSLQLWPTLPHLLIHLYLPDHYGPDSLACTSLGERSSLVQHRDCSLWFPDDFVHLRNRLLPERMRILPARKIVPPRNQRVAHCGWCTSLFSPGTRRCDHAQYLRDSNAFPTY